MATSPPSPDQTYVHDSTKRYYHLVSSKLRISIFLLLCDGAIWLDPHEAQKVWPNPLSGPVWADLGAKIAKNGQNEVQKNVFFCKFLGTIGL